MERITVENLGKQYTRRHAVQKSLKAFALGMLKNTVRKEKFWALRKASFSVSEGETLGIIGANGAGKSTLLGLIARTTQPTEGALSIRGRMSSLLELGAGFHPDLTGRENIYLNASILGISRREIDRKFDAIADFSGIGPFIDSPVKFYSSGMYVRLGFAVAIEVEPDILLMDEVLAVGDEEFRKKSLAKVEEFKSKGKTMLIVSHDLETIKKISDRILFLDKGEVVNLGDPLRVVDEYRNYSVYKKGSVTVKEFGTREIVFGETKLKDAKGNIKNEFSPGEQMVIDMAFEAKTEIADPVFGFSIADPGGNTVLGTNTLLQKASMGRVKGRSSVRIIIRSLNLQRGLYHLSAACHSPDHRIQYHRKDNFLDFRVTAGSEDEGTVYMPVEFQKGEARSS